MFVERERQRSVRLEHELLNELARLVSNDER